MKTTKPHQIAISLKIEMDGETVHLENYETEITAGMLKNNVQDFIHRFI